MTTLTFYLRSVVLFSTTLALSRVCEASEYELCAPGASYDAEAEIASLDELGAVLRVFGFEQQKDFSGTQKQTGPDKSFLLVCGLSRTWREFFRLIQVLFRRGRVLSHGRRKLSHRPRNLSDGAWGLWEGR